MPHSDIRGSQPAGGSPRLIAAIHVLHRLSVPRHPPCALASSASRSLDLTKPAGSMFSLYLYLCLAQLLFSSSGAPSGVTRTALSSRWHKKGPTLVEPPDLGPRESRRSTYVVGDSDLRMCVRSPRQLRGTHQQRSSAQRIHTISNALAHVQVGWSRGDSNP